MPSLPAPTSRRSIAPRRRRRAALQAQTETLAGTSSIASEAHGTACRYSFAERQLRRGEGRKSRQPRGACVLQ
jgi:hypothetical protein